MRKDYSKLVRDKVPDIIEAAGKKLLTRRLSEDRYKRALKQKLVEEAREVQGAESIAELTEELADVAEVMDTLIAVLGISWQEVREAQKQKKLERGGFEKRLKLMWVEERD